jgi:hypothetical protein
MLNEEINKYIEMYSELVSAYTGLHNTHISFLKYIGRDTGLDTRKHLRKIEVLAKEMKVQGQLICKKSMEQKRLEKKARVAENKRLKALPKKMGRPKGRKNGNNKST